MHYLWRSASMGLSFAAFLAGKIPNTIPIDIEKSAMPRINIGLKSATSLLVEKLLIKKHTNSEPDNPSIVPMIPPRSDIEADSTKNWKRIEPVLAPSAFLIPISLVRSVTDTSMIFITPIPPTKRDIAATNMISNVTAVNDELTVCKMAL